MSAPQWAWEAARRFWADVGGWAHPADLRAAIDRKGLMVRVDGVAGLSTDRVRDYLARRGIPIPRGVADRPLRGCLMAGEEEGWIFLDADDAEDERRFSLAHELAHYLRHHLERRQTKCAIGRLRAALRGVRLVEYLHSRERGAGFISQDVRDAEEEADWLAVELLAPEEELSARLSPNAGRLEIADVLRQTFGLPESIASVHAARLIPEWPECPLIARLKNTEHLSNFAKRRGTAHAKGGGDERRRRERTSPTDSGDQFRAIP